MEKHNLNEQDFRKQLLKLAAGNFNNLDYHISASYVNDEPANLEKAIQHITYRHLCEFCEHEDEPDVCKNCEKVKAISSHDLDKAYKLAIKALQEKAEREKGCEYCKEQEQRNESGRIFYKGLTHDARFLTTLDDAHLQVAFDDKSGWVLHLEDDSGDRMFDVKVTACPMCGRKLVR